MGWCCFRYVLFSLAAGMQWPSWDRTLGLQSQVSRDLFFFLPRERKRERQTHTVVHKLAVWVRKKEH
jgi:hypothetical protein